MANGERIKFGPFEADLRTGELFRRGGKIAIQQKPFQLLTILLQRAGQLITREELHQLLWPDTFVQKDLSLNTAVRKLRLALNDADQAHRYIETVGSRGYRFTQRVTVTGATGTALPNSATRRVRLAVVPLENLSGTENETFADGLTEQLIARLGRVSEQVSVIAPVSSMQYKHTAKGAAQICQELHCDYVLSGSVLRVTGRVRVTAKLIRGNDQTCVWTDSFASDSSEIFTIQDEIAAQIAQALQTVLPRGGRSPANTPHDPAIVAKYLKATAFAGQAGETGFENAARLLLEVLEAEPGFAAAHADLARLYANAAMFGIMSPDRLFQQVRIHAGAALQFSEQIEMAHIALGYLHFYYEADWDEAAESFRRAIKINPSCVWAYIALSQVMTAIGSVEDGIRIMQQADELDPVSPIVSTMLGCAYYFAGDYPKAGTILADCLSLHPGFPIALSSLSWVKLATDERDASIVLAREAYERSHKSPLMHAQYCFALAAAGDRNQAQAAFERFRASLPEVFPAYWLALPYLALGEQERALDLLEQCMQTRCAWRVLMLVDPKLKPLATHARFRSMLRELRFPEAVASGN